jgi:hypothetical protein
METLKSFNIRELSTLLAALRFYQSHLNNLVQDQPDLLAIATNDGSVTPLTLIEIDALCEQLNSESI